MSFLSCSVLQKNLNYAQEVEVQDANYEESNHEHHGDGSITGEYDTSKEQLLGPENLVEKFCRRMLIE